MTRTAGMCRRTREKHCSQPDRVVHMEVTTTVSSGKPTRQKPNNDLSSLAIFGGTPAFDTQLHVGRPNIGDREKLFARIESLLDRRWLTNGGPYVREFEERI